MNWALALSTDWPVIWFFNSRATMGIPLRDNTISMEFSLSVEYLNCLVQVRMFFSYLSITSGFKVDSGLK